MARHAKTINIVEKAHEILAEQHPMTLRQVYYRLVSAFVVKNNQSQYPAPIPI